MHKKLLILFTSVVILFVIFLPLFYLFSSPKEIQTHIKNKIFHDYLLKNNANWFAKIANTYAIPQKTVQEETALFALSGRKVDARIKKGIENKVMNDTIILIKALEEGTLDEEKFNQYIWHSIKKGIIDYYIQSRYYRENKAGSDLGVTDSEVAAFYKEHKNIYTGLNISNQHASSMIKNSMLKQKQQKEYMKFMNKLLSKYKLENTIQTRKE